MKQLSLEDTNSGLEVLHILSYDDVLIKVDEGSYFYESIMKMLDMGHEYFLHKYVESQQVPDILIVGQTEFTIDEATQWAKQLGYLCHSNS